jgi:hypothetical protein
MTIGGQAAGGESVCYICEIVGRDIAELRNYSGRKALIKLGPKEGFLMID